MFFMVISLKNNQFGELKMKQFGYKLIDFEVFKNLNLLNLKKIVLWGAAAKGRQIKRTLEKVGIKVDVFCDSDVSKWGQTFDGIPVISPYELRRRFAQNQLFNIISCVFGETDVLRSLQELELFQVPFLSYWGVKTACVLYGIPLVPEGTLETYDRIWKYQIRNRIKEESLIKYLRKLQTYSSDAIWCMQPGKVASLTVEKRLQQAGLQTIQGHDFFYLSMYGKNTLKDILAEMVSSKISKGIKIVTGVREPLSRDYSAFWEPFTRDLPYISYILNKDFQRMYEYYIKLLSKGYDYTRSFLKESMPFVWRDEFEWFNEEIRKHIGIDIYQYSFNQKKGYQVIKQGKTQIFIYKTEKLNDIMPMLSEFVGKNISSSEDVNEAEYKSYYLAYKEFRKKIRLPYDYVENYYKNNPYVDHFYTKDEKKMYLSKWKESINE